jgi:hypothetical protein
MQLRIVSRRYSSSRNPYARRWMACRGRNPGKVYVSASRRGVRGLDIGEYRAKIFHSCTPAKPRENKLLSHVMSSFLPTRFHEDPSFMAR